MRSSSSMPAAPTLRWHTDDHLVIDDTRYVLMNEPAEPDEIRLFKPRVMLECYDPIVDEFRGANIVELGILSGGSTAYFLQRCAPRRLVAVDRSPERVPELDEFVAASGLRDRVRLHYGVDQSDTVRLQAIAHEGFGDEPIDLVIDDASHLYDPTVASFEILFPLVRPGGLYVIEDWTADDWLAITFAGVVQHREPMARAMMEAWLANVLAEPTNVVGQVFERWILRAIGDPTLAHHDDTLSWLAELDRPGATDRTLLIRDHLAPVIEAGPPAAPAPTLGTLGLQLLLAVKGLCSAIASVTVTPWWIEVRRGGEVDPATFTVESIGRDHLGLLASHASASDVRPR